MAITIFKADAMLARYILSSCVRPSVCPSQAGVVSKRLDESSWFLAWRLPSTYHTLCFKEIWVSPKIRELPTVTLSHTPDSKKFAATSRSRRQQNSSSSLSTVEFVDDTYTTVDESWLFTTSRSTVTLQLHHDRRRHHHCCSTVAGGTIGERPNPHSPAEGQR